MTLQEKKIEKLEKLNEKAEMFIIKNDEDARVIKDGYIKEGAQLLTNFLIENMEQYHREQIKEKLMRFIAYFKNNATKDAEGVGCIDVDQYLLHWIPNIKDVDEYLNN